MGPSINRGIRALALGAGIASLNVPVANSSAAAFKGSLGGAPWISRPVSNPVNPFVRTATDFTITSEADIGAIARKSGGEVMFFHPVPFSTELHPYNSSMTFEGRAVPMRSDIEARGRSLYVGRGNSSSGKAQLIFSGTVYERVIGPNDKLSVPVDLPAEERDKYLAPTRNIRTEGDEFAKRMDKDGLRRGNSEKPWDYMMRVADYMRSHFTYGAPKITADDMKTYLIFDAGRLHCNDATVFMGRLARTNGVPYRCIPGTVLKADGSTEYHSRGEFYDRERGWVPVDGAEVVGPNRDLPIIAIFGRDVPQTYERAGWRFIPMMDNSALEVVVPNPDGEVAPGFYSEFCQGFSYGVPGKMGGGIAPMDTTRAFYTAKYKVLDSAGRWQAASPGGN